MFRAARPIVWISAVLPRRKPSLSASRIAIERDLRQVEPFPKQVDADEHVVLAEPELADDLDPVERVDLGVQVARLDARLEQVVGQVLGHLLRQRRDERALAQLLAAADLVQQVVDLVLRRAQLDLGVDDPGRPHELLGDSRRVAELERAGRRGHEHHLVHLVQELVEAERPVVERGREPEAEVDQRLLARAVALVHAADLRHRLVRLVDEDDHVLGEVVEERERVRPRRTALEDPRVVLDPVAEAELLHHLEVVLGALPEPVRLEHLALELELLRPARSSRGGSRRRRARSSASTSRTRSPARSRRCRASPAPRRSAGRSARSARPRRRRRRCGTRSPGSPAAPRRRRRAPGSARGRAPRRCGRTGCRSACAGRGRGRAPPPRRGSARARATPPASRGRRCTRPRRRRRRLGG